MEVFLENHDALSAEQSREVHSSTRSRKFGADGEQQTIDLLKVRNQQACDELLSLLIEHHADHKSVRKFLPKPKPPAPPVVVPEPIKVAPVVLAPIIPLPVSMPEPTDAERLPSIAIIARETAKFYEVTLMDMYSARRTANICRPRQIGMYLAKTMTLKSLPQIGRRFGGRDHTTILYAVRKIEGLVPINERLADEIEVLKLRILQAVLNQAPAVIQ